MKIDAGVRVGFVAFLSLLFISSGFSSTAQGTTSVISPSAHYVSDHHASRVIVFVHGLNGNARDTWLFDSAHYWPKMIADDPSFADTDIYVASYPTPARGNHMSVNDLISYLSDELEDAGIFSQHKQVIFVAHSLGGIVVQQLLLTYRDKNLASKVPFIYLYATPQTGSDLANIGKLFKPDPLIKELAHGEGNFVLASMDTAWLHSGFENIKRYCAYETQTEKGFKVVSRESATRGCNDQVAIDSNHQNIVKPRDTAARSYTALKNKFIELSTQNTLVATPLQASPQIIQQQTNYGGSNLQVGNLYATPPGRRLDKKQIANIIASMKQIPKGSLVIVAMLPIDSEMRDFGGAIRFAAAQSGWTEDGIQMDTNKHSYITYRGLSERRNSPQGTHCIETPSNDPTDHRAADVIKILLSNGVNCNSGEPGAYPVVPNATLTIYIGVNTN